LTHFRQNRSYLHGAAILAAAMAIARVLGGIYRIPLANILGDAGFSTFTVAQNLYVFLLTVCTVGLPVALSKIVAAADALGRPGQVRRLFFVGRNTFLIPSLTAFLVMTIFHRQLAEWSNSPSAAYAILVLGPALLLVCQISAYRGYCQGLSDMVPTSVSQIIEAFVRLAVGLGLAWVLATRGFQTPITIAGASLGVTASVGVSCIYLYFAKRKRERAYHAVYSPADTPDASRQMVRNLLQVAVPFTIGSSILSALPLLDNTIILGRLQGVYLSELQAVGSLTYVEMYEAAYAAAKSLHGTYSMTVLLSNLPASFIVPISVAILPVISAALAKQQDGTARQTTESGIRVTCLLALPAGVGLMVLAEPIMQTLFFGSFAPQGPMLLFFMGISAIFLCFFQVTNGVMQAYGLLRYLVVSLLAGAVVRIALTWFLLVNPWFGIYGAAVSTLVCFALISFINAMVLKRKITNPPQFSRVLIKPLICVAVMGVAAWGIYALSSYLLSALLPGLSERVVILGALLASIGLAMVVYLVLVIVLKALTLEDVRMLPKGEKLAKLLRIRS